MAFNSADWAIDYDAKTVTNDDSGTGTNLPAAFGDNTYVGPILEFFQWLAGEFAATAQMDDAYGIESQTPTVFKWLNGWTFGHADDFKYLEGGDIEDPAGSGTATADSFWSNAYSIGDQTEGTQIYLIQDDAEVTPWWITGNVDILVLVKDTGVWIESNNAAGAAIEGGIWLFAREFGDFYDHNFADISNGRTPVGINTSKDGNNDSGELYLSVTSAAGFVAGTFVVGGTSGAVGKIEKIVTNDIYLNAVRGGPFVISETLTEYSDREAQTATGQSTTNDGATAFTDVVAGYTLVLPVFADISRDLNNGDGLQPYKADVDGNGATMKQHYEWLKWIVRYASASTVNSDEGQEYRSALEGTYADVKVAPFGTLAGTTFYGARGIWLSDYTTADFVLIDADGDQQAPPDYQKVIASHTNLSTTNVFVAEITGDGGTIIKDQYTHNQPASDATHLEVNEAIDINKTPQTGIVRVGDTQYVYTSFTGSIFTVTTDPTGEADDADVYVPLLDVLADAASESSDNIIYSGTPFWCRTVTRKYGYKPYTQDAQFAANGLPFTPILADDPQAT
ncbi:MAG: hypothetical protein DRI97_00155 [Bacteroidetes bacterium]|nr:MAG: hypothetical protein DRI97_00155 [Bacteroidota bacterium]